MYTRGFPNCFFITSAQSAFSPNYTHVLDILTKHIAHVASQCIMRQVRTVQPLQEAEDEWVKTIVNFAHLRRDALRECTPGYYNNEGKLTEKAVQSAPYVGGLPAFTKLLEEWRSTNNLAGLELEPVKSQGLTKL
jgi:cyclohexanone monooxygenase